MHPLRRHQRTGNAHLRRIVADSTARQFAVGQWRQTHTAVAADAGRHALRDLEAHAGLDQQRQIVMRVCVNEAARFDLLAPAPDGTADFYDATAVHRHVGDAARCAAVRFNPPASSWSGHCMTHIVLRAARVEDFGTLVELNAQEVQQTSPMDLERLRELAQLSSYHTVAEVDGRVAAFLLAMREGAPYLNDNYAWFAARFAQFLYVDRIVVAAELAGLKIGSRLYEDLFDYARSYGIQAITCEYNIQPPNPASQRFHDKFGFKEVGRQWVAQGTKQVSLHVVEV